MRLRIGLRAAAQIEKADRWWTESRLGAPGALREDLDSAFSALLGQPAIGTRVANAKLDGVRRLHLGRVRYYVYYRVRGNELVILAVWHSSRGHQPAFLRESDQSGEF